MEGHSRALWDAGVERSTASLHIRAQTLYEALKNILLQVGFVFVALV